MYDYEATKRYRATAKGRAAVSKASRQWRETSPAAPALIAASRAKSMARNPRNYVFSNKKSRAAQRGIAFSLVFDDMIWPEYCPVLGIKIDYARGHRGGLARNDSPSFDRIVHGGEYSQDNVLIVSNRANTLRGNHSTATLLKLAQTAETKKIYTFYSNLERSLAVAA